MPKTTSKKKGKNKQVDNDVDKQPILINLRESLKELTEVGSGFYSTVTVSEWTRPNGEKKIVAVKCLKEAILEEHLQEVLNNMASLEHKHIVKLHGICLGQSLRLVTEYAECYSLRDAMRNEKRSYFCQVTQLKMFAVQVAQGMTYLSEKNLVHCSLNARNVLVGKSGLVTQVKISDVGLARALDLGQRKATDRQLSDAPWKRWCAPEVKEGHALTHKADVYGYGGLLWEMLTFGGEPWNENGHVILQLDERLPQPKACSTEMYQLMKLCWAERPDDRPGFDVIIIKLQMIELPVGSATMTVIRSGLDSEYILSFIQGSKITIIERLDGNQCRGQNENADVGLVPSDAIDLNVKPQERSIEDYDIEIGTPFNLEHHGPASLIREWSNEGIVALASDPVPVTLPDQHETRENEEKFHENNVVDDIENDIYIDMNEFDDSYLTMEYFHPRNETTKIPQPPLNETTSTSVDSTGNNKTLSPEQVTNLRDYKVADSPPESKSKKTPPPIPKRTDLEDKAPKITTRTLQEMQPAEAKGTSTLPRKRPVPTPRRKIKRCTTYEIPSKEKIEIRPRSSTVPLGSTGLPGPTVPLGSTGLPGPTVPLGSTGLPGPTVPLGSTGLPGPSVPLRPTGLPGPTVPLGSTGLKGPTVPLRSTGLPGPTVPLGSTGLQGPTVPLGQTGLPGPTGPLGSTGVPGPTVPQGPTCQIGLAGPPVPTRLSEFEGIRQLDDDITKLPKDCDLAQNIRHDVVDAVRKENTSFTDQQSMVNPRNNENNAQSNKQPLDEPLYQVPKQLASAVHRRSLHDTSVLQNPTGPTVPLDSTGLPGPTVPLGSTGLPGPTDPLRPTGPTVPLGSTSLPGPTVPLGPTDPTVPLGSTGLPGPTGPLGSAGPEGPLGPPVPTRPSEFEGIRQLDDDITKLPKDCDLAQNILRDVVDAVRKENTTLTDQQSMINPRNNDNNDLEQPLVDGPLYQVPKRLASDRRGTHDPSVLQNITGHAGTELVNEVPANEAPSAKLAQPSVGLVNPSPLVDTFAKTFMEIKNNGTNPLTANGVMNDIEYPHPHLLLDGLHDLKNQPSSVSKTHETPSATKENVDVREKSTYGREADSAIKIIQSNFPQFTKQECYARLLQYSGDVEQIMKVLQVAKVTCVDEYTARFHLNHCNWKADRAILYILGDP